MFAPPLLATDVAAGDITNSSQSATGSPTSIFSPSSPALHSSSSFLSSDVPASPSLSSSDPRLSRRGPNLSATRRPIRRWDVPQSPAPLLPFTSLATPLMHSLSSASFALPSHPSTLTPAFSSIAHTPATGISATSSTLPALPPFSLSSAAATAAQPLSLSATTSLPAATTTTDGSIPTTSASSDVLFDGDDVPLGLLPPLRKRRKRAQPAAQQAQRTRKTRQAQRSDVQQTADNESKEGEEEEERKEIPHAQRTLADFIRDNKSGELSASVKQRMERQKQEREAARKKRQEEKEAERKRVEEEKQRDEGGTPAASGDMNEQKEQSEGVAASAEERKEELPADERKDGGNDAADEANDDEEAVDGDSEAAQDESKEDEAGDNSNSAESVDAHLSVAPQMKIVNGQIVINEESLVVPSPDSLTSDIPLLAAAPATRFTSATFSKASHAAPWTPEETALFYRLLSSFGTDFTLLSSALKGRSRGEVKRKFKKEERERPAVVEESLKKRVKMDMSEFSKRRNDKSAAEESNNSGEVKGSGETDGAAASGGAAGGASGSGGGRKKERVMLNNRAGKRKKKGQQQQVGAEERRKEDSGAAEAGDTSDSYSNGRANHDIGTSSTSESRVSDNGGSYG